MRKRLSLVNPVGRNRSGLVNNPWFRYPPVGLGILASLTPATWDVELVDENWEPFSPWAADLVGLTALTPSANRAYEIAGICRGQGVPVVMGGVHASLLPDEASRYVDAVVIGEAEGVWREVLDDAAAGRLQPVYRGTPPDMADVPAPRRDLFNPGYRTGVVQTSRGCPLDCDFCSVTAFSGHEHRRRPNEAVLNELAAVPQHSVFFLDDNIVGYGAQARRQALDLFKGMVKRNLRKRWGCQASVNFADDNELLHWAARAGCRLVFLGLESEDSTGLAEMNKRLNLRRGPAEYTRLIRRIHRAGIGVVGGFIFGLDSDTRETMQRRLDYVVSSNADVIQATLLTPTPGTKLFHRLTDEQRLLHTNFPVDWERYDFTDVVHRREHVDPDTLLRFMSEVARRTFSTATLLRRARTTLRETSSPVTTMLAWRYNRAYGRVARLCYRARDLPGSAATRGGACVRPGRAPLA